MKKLFLLCFVVSLLIFSPFVNAFEVVVFEQYDTVYSVKGRTLVVEKDLVLRNVGTNPIIPGEISFKLFEMHGDSSRSSNVRDVVALHNNNVLDTRVDSHTDFSDVVVHIWNPLLPDFDYSFSLSYEIDYRPRGVLFHEVVFPVEETTISINDRTTTMLLPRRYSVTYAPHAVLSSTSDNKIVDWGSRSELSLEYTIIPLPEQMPFRMVSVFWLSVLILLGVIFIVLNVKRTRTSSKKKK